MIRCSCAMTLLLAVSCTPMGSTGGDSRSIVRAWAEKAGAGLQETNVPQAVTIPRVDFGKLPSKFGKAQWKSGPAGNYEITYPNEAGLAGAVIDSFSLLGSPEPIAPLKEAPAMMLPMPDGKSRESAVPWRSVHAPGLKRDLRFYQTGYAMGDTNDTWESEPFSFTDAHGSTGFYQVSIEALEETEVRALLARLRVGN